MKKYILAIDQGTTSTRTILFDRNREIVAISQKESFQFYPQSGWVEQDANIIWMTTLELIKDVMKKCNIQPSQIASIGISNQRETTVLWDKQTGIPIYSAIVWQSRQTDEICDLWKKRGFEKIIREKTGLRIDPYFSASKITWILDHVDKARERAERGEILFGTIDTWLVYKLSGGRTHISDVSNASRTLLSNIETCDWDDDLLTLLNIPKLILPKIMPTSYEYTKTDPSLFSGEEIAITCVVGDQQAALFGQGCFEKGMVKNTYGTGGFMLMNTGNKAFISKQGLLTTVAWKINNEITYALEGSIFISGSLIQWLRDELGLLKKASESEAMAYCVESNNGVYIVPAFVGMGAPYWDEKCRGAILGITQGVNKNHIVRAALEAMAYQSRDVLEAMQKDCEIKIKELQVDGGAIENKFLLQFQSDLLQCIVKRYKVKEITALGAATLAGLAIGFYNINELNYNEKIEYIPKLNKEEMDLLYKDWKKAVNACRTF